MQKRRLADGLQVSAVGLGCLSMSGVYGPADERESVATLHRALELGIDLLDTSDMYGAGHNEELIGRAVRGRRERAVVATKFGHVLDSDGRPVGVDCSPENARRSCERSLARLGVETIDVYFAHRVDPAVPIEETVGAMAALVAEGKVRHIGICEAAPQTIRRAHAVHPLAAVQTELSLWFRDPEETVVKACRELGIGFVAYSPLGRGLLTGGITHLDDFADGDRRREHPRFQAEALERNLELADTLEALAAAKGCSLAQLAVAWVLSRGDHVVPIPGAKQRAHVEENAEAARIELSPDELARIDAASPRGAGAGLRYPEQHMSVLEV